MIHIERPEGFSLPSVLAQRYMGADGPALKTALFILLNGDCDEARISRETGLSPEAVSRSVSFWKAAGLMEDRQSVEGFAPSKAEPLDTVPAKKKLSHAELARQILSDPELAVLFQESQQVLGRPLDPRESAKLAEVVSSTSVSVHAILMLMAYWAPKTRSSSVVGKAANTALSWEKEGITTIAAAEDRIRLMEQRDRNYQKTAEVMKLDPADLSANDKKKIDKWFEDFGYDESFVDEVMARNPEAGIPYVHAVLKDWHRKGYASLLEASASPSNARPQAEQQSVPDGDIDPLIRQILQNMGEED